MLKAIPRVPVTVIDPMQMPGMKEFHASQFKGELKIGRRHKVRVLSIEDASCQYAQLRDESGEGGSTFPAGVLTIDGKRLHVSYNAKVWADKDASTRGDKPLFNPYL